LHLLQAIVGLARGVDIVQQIDQRRPHPREGAEDNTAINH
jgi:hypothetical protein